MRRGLPAIVLSLLLVGLASTFSLADDPEGAVYIPYQGFLEREGAPVGEPVAMAFHLYDAEVGGALLHTTNLVVTPVDGRFAARIGPVDAALLGVPELHLGLEVEGVPLAGRQRIRSSPYAVRGVVGEPFVADSVVTDSVVAGAVSAEEVVADIVDTDTLAVAGNARVNQLELGSMGHPDWAGVRHQAQTAANSFALQQRSDGTITRVNAAPGGRVSLAVGDVEHVSVNPNGTLFATGNVVVDGGLTVGGNVLSSSGRMEAASGMRAAGNPVVTGVTTCNGQSCGCPAGYQRLGQDLNEDAGGDYIYLCVRYSP